MRVACLLIVSLLTLRAQQFPDASALLESSVGALKTYNTYEFTEVTTGGPAGMEQAMLHQGTSSGKMRMSQKIGGVDGVLIVSDGKNMWMYMAMMKRYMKMPPDGAMEGMAQAAMAGFQAGMANLKPKVLRTETLDVDGELHDCWVVESRTPGMTVAGATMKESVQTHWVDKISSIEYKTAITASVQVPGQKEAIDTSSTVSRHGYKFNQPLDDALFVFNPPVGATETDELFPGMKDMFAKPEPTPAAKTSVAVPMASEPRAFVPNLTPVEQTEAALPQGVDEGVRAMVQMLVTIDPAGNVVKAEPLTGTDVLRKAAVDVVQQWKFRPVIRDGAAVYAYTEAIVDFGDYSKPANPEQTDLHDEMVALQRFASLSAQFPRSAQQELADLEQDRGHGSEQSYALPQLAKAALKADALDKAAEYATELLRSSSSGGDYGQAVHDGNMVLGAIALRRGDVPQAKQYLAASAKTTGSPQLDSFGPNMSLAKALLEKGERDAVLDYFEACRAFWKMGAKQLEAWSATVRGGGMPSFGANLVY